jgi:thermostable 8-oxoguanine DNA glycosylase
MKINWQIDPDDIERVNAFYEQHCGNPFVHARIATNLRDEKPPISQSDFWNRMVGCLLTTQQRSGPESPVTKFLLTNPSPLEYELCKQQADLAEFARQVISEFGGLLYYNNISKFLSANLTVLEDSGWEPTFRHLDEVRSNSSPATERKAAEFIDNKFKGFGPKQSRNLLQGLGLSRFEIPIDSRITKWLNHYGFPVKLTANPLQDQNYYNFVSDGVQRLCEACDIMPCVLDAAIFSSFDDGKWTEDNVVW